MAMRSASGWRRRPSTARPTPSSSVSWPSTLACRLGQSRSPVALRVARRSSASPPERALSLRLRSLGEVTVEPRALALLQQLTGDPGASFRPGQLEAITRLVEKHGRTLVVQRTGWGKSAVYFIATRLLRDTGAGPTVLISPLLALMRNQLEAAERAGV